MENKKPLPDTGGLPHEKLLEKLREIRNAIREHRDAKGDDRCHLDDDLLYLAVLEIPLPIKLPPKDKFLKKCYFFFHMRQAPLNNLSPLYAPPQNDYDLLKKSAHELRTDIKTLRTRVFNHYSEKIKTWRDDKALYDSLPDYVNYDTRLPEGFCENCERFYDTKKKQKKLVLDRW